MSATRTDPFGMGASDDVVEFVERSTYAIWNDRNPDLVQACYLPTTVIWGDGGDLVGDVAVTEATRTRQAELADYHGVIQDTIWTGDVRSGYRTSMRWTSAGSVPDATQPGGRRPVRNSCIANCVVRDGQYVEEWAGGNEEFVLAQLGADLDAAARAVTPSTVVTGEAGRERTRSLGVAVPAVPADVGGAGLLVVELLHDLYVRRDLDVADRRYAPGASYVFGAARYRAGADGVRAEVRPWLDLLPDLDLSVEELYWHDDTPTRSRVAVRYRLTGCTRHGGAPVAITGIHHVHVRRGQVVSEWAEYDELALRSQIRSAATT